MRLDKFLKVSRLIKRRTVANEACDAEKVSVNGKPARASYEVKTGDIIEIDIPNRTINVGLTDTELAERRKEMEARGAKAWKPEHRDRVVSKALQAYAMMASSADKGAVRDLSNLQ